MGIPYGVCPPPPLHSRRAVAGVGGLVLPAAVSVKCGPLLQGFSSRSRQLVTAAFVILRSVQLVPLQRFMGWVGHVAPEAFGYLEWGSGESCGDLAFIRVCGYETSFIPHSLGNQNSGRGRTQKNLITGPIRRFKTPHYSPLPTPRSHFADLGVESLMGVSCVRPPPGFQ